MKLPADTEVLVEASRQRYYRDDAVRWVWIFYGLAQAVVTMLLAFDVIDSIDVAAVVTAIALIVYVGVNELLVRPYRSRPAERPPQGRVSDETVPDGPTVPEDVLGH